MTNPDATYPHIPVTIDTEHGALHGELTLVPLAPGMIVLTHAGAALDQREHFLAAQFVQAGFSTLTVDLLAHQEDHFPDIHNNVPLLAHRLLTFLGLLKTRMQIGEIPATPIGLYAAQNTTPVVIRVASLRDHDIAAIVCRGGLIDLAGVLYLKSLECPLLLLHEQSDHAHAASNQRALCEVSSTHKLIAIGDIDVEFSVSPAFKEVVFEATQWFKSYLK